MKVKVSELKDDALDWAVAKCAGRTLRHMPLGPQGGHGWWVWEETPSGKGGILIDKSIYMPVGPRRVPKTRSSGERWSPSTDWAQGGPVLEGANVTITRVEDEYDADSRGFTTCERIPLWLAKSGPTFMVDRDGGKYGRTPLVAAMRCFVASKLGEEIEVPAALTVNR